MSHAPTPPPNRRRQRGIALIILLVAVVLAVAVLLVNLGSGSAARARARENSMAMLQTAKEALLLHAWRYDQTHAGQPPGYLPCPDVNGDGIAELSCDIAGASVIGRLPWRTLGLHALRDQSGACLWYAVSGAYKNNPKQVLTSDSDGQFVIRDGAGQTLAGAVPGSLAMAVIFAAHTATNGQIRAITTATATPCGSDTGTDTGNLPANYLDTENGINNAAGTDAAAAAGQPGSIPLPTTLASVFTIGTRNNSAFNDLLTWIDPADFQDVHERMSEWMRDKVRGCLSQYATGGTGKFPWAAPLSTSLPPAYLGNPGSRFGRLADLPNITGDASGMPGAWPLDPSDPTGTFRCFTSSGLQTDYSWWWWQAPWKEQVFIGIDAKYAPTGAGTGTPTLTLDGVAAKAVALVAGRKTSIQARGSNMEKGTITNYLGAANSPNTGTGAIPPGNEQFQALDAGDHDRGAGL